MLTSPHFIPVGGGRENKNNNDNSNKYIVKYVDDKKHS